MTFTFNTLFFLRSILGQALPQPFFRRVQPSVFLRMHVVCVSKCSFMVVVSFLHVHAVPRLFRCCSWPRSDAELRRRGVGGGSWVLVEDQRGGGGRAVKKKARQPPKKGGIAKKIDVFRALWVA